MKAAGRLKQKAIYGPLCQQTLEARLKRELRTNFGFEHLKVVADVLIQRFLAIIDEFAPRRERLCPYQIMVLAVDKNEKFGYGKRMEQCQLVPVIVTVVTPKELQQLAEGTKLHELRPQIAARILQEAYEQGGVLSFSTVGLLTGLRSPSLISLAIAMFYEHNPDVTLPHSGTIFDLGRTMTHKQTAILLKHQGLLEQEIARRTNHHPSAVARYLNDDERVGQLWEEGQSVRYNQKLWIDSTKKAAYPWGEQSPKSGWKGRREDTPCSSLPQMTLNHKLQKSCNRWMIWPPPRKRYSARKARVA